MQKIILVNTGESCGICTFINVLGIFDSANEAVKAAIEFVENNKYPQFLEIWKGTLGVLWDFNDYNNENLYEVISLNNEVHITKEKLLEKLNRIYKSGV